VRSRRAPTNAGGARIRGWTPKGLTAPELRSAVSQRRAGALYGSAMLSGANDTIICPHCDVLHRAVDLSRREVAACIACGRVLARHRSLSIDQLLALTVTAAVLFLVANSYPLMTVEVHGMQTEATVWDAARLMLHGWTAWPAAVLALTMFILPMLQIALLLWILAFARVGRRAPGIRVLLVALHRSRPWSMTEVFLLGALVAVVRLSSWVHVTPGVGIWALASLTILLTILSMVEPQFWWTLMQART